MFDGGGDILFQSYGIVQIPAKIQVLGWTIISDSISTSDLQVLSSTYDNHPIFDIISGTTKSNVDYPKLTTANKATNSSLTNWSPIIEKDSILKFNLVSNDKASFISINLKCVKL